MNSRIDPSELPDRRFRFTIGLIALFAGLFGVVALFVVEIPPTNQQPILIALGVVLGWGTSVVQSEFGSTTAGRKLVQRAAEQALPLPPERK